MTGDQDWAPDWALDAALRLAADAGVPFHVFATNRSELLDHDRIDIGIHPNFLRNSTHGATDAEVVAHCLELFPRARTARSHCFAESTPALTLLLEHGIVADSNTCLHLQPNISPQIHGAGLIRMPVFMEDDVLIRHAGRVPAIDDLFPTLFSPGLKVFNFHPALLAINAPDANTYEAARPALYGSSPEPVAPQRDRTGVADLFQALVGQVTARGHRFERFEDLVDEASTRFTSEFPAGLCGWRPGL
jgi:hypothetical protein